MELTNWSQRPLALLSSEILMTLGNMSFLMSQFPSLRGTLPPIIGEHAGNFGPTSTMLIAGTMLGVAVQMLGRQEHDRHIERLGRLLPYISIGLGALANLAVETQFIFKPELLNENLGDYAMGMIAIALTAPFLEWMMRRFS